MTENSPYAIKKSTDLEQFSMAPTKMTTLMAHRLLRLSRVCLDTSPMAKRAASPQPLRPFSSAVPRGYSGKREEEPPSLNGKHQGSFARTDRDVQFAYPAEQDVARSSLSQERGAHVKRTLASFSLEDRVAVITGGARGLGLVMAQALIISGADVALVDLNRKSSHRYGFSRCAQALLS